MADLKAAFTKSNPEARLNVSFGSSGNFFAQIRSGAPMDVFLSADTDYPSRLIDKGSASRDSLTHYAIGHLALWTSNLTLPLSTNLATVLANASIRRIALANPSHSPYGRASKATLQHLELWTPLQQKLVFADNAAQALQFAQSGNAQIAILPLSMAQARPNSSCNYVKIPSHWHAPIRQSGVLTTQGSQNPIARKFLAFLVTGTGQQIFKSHGFSVPD